jgi:hypothetical protein
MPKYLIAICLFASMVSACGTQPKLAMPDGRSRVPINAPAAIEEYNAAAARDNLKARDETQQRQLAAVKRDLAELKALMAEVSPHQNALDDAARTSAPVRVTAGRPGSTSLPAKGIQIRPSEKITIRDQSTQFTIAPRVGETRFAPSAGFQQALLAAATRATHIEIRGGSEVATTKLESAKIASARRQNARRYLLNNGIDPAKVKITHLPADVPSSDHSAAEGKARKRSVEIEVMVPASAASVAKAAQINGATR